MSKFNSDIAECLIIVFYIPEWKCSVRTFLWYNGGKEEPWPKTVSKYFNHGTPYYIK
jgi:hypothetical protein